MVESKTDLILADQPLPPAFGGRVPGGVKELRNRIQQAMDTWLMKVKSERTRIAYRKDVEQFLEYLGIKPTHIEHMTRVLPEDVSNWRDELLERGGRPDEHGNPTEGANSTVARKLTALRSFFSFLQSYGYRGANPAHPHFVDTPTVSKEGLTPGIAPKLVVSLLDVPELEDDDGRECPDGVRDRAIMALLAFMAIRVDELHKINVGNIRQDGEHTIILIKGKGKKDRKGVMPPAAASVLNAWIDLAGIRDDRRGPLFRPGKSARGRGRDGFKRERLSIRPIQRLVKKYCQACGIDEAVSVHSFRVTAATEADKAGVPLNQIQHWLGHEDPRTTLRYIRTGQDLDSSPAYVLQSRFSKNSLDQRTVEIRNV